MDVDEDDVDLEEDEEEEDDDDDDKDAAAAAAADELVGAGSKACASPGAARFKCAGCKTLAVAWPLSPFPKFP